MEILLYLVSSRGEVVSKQELHDEVWKEVYVTDNALTRTVSKLRKALDDDPVKATYIDTISKSGYRLIAPVVLHLTHSNSHSRLGSFSHKKWLRNLVAAIVLLGFSLMSISSKDTFSGFYDPVPVSTLVGPEIGHAISPDGEKISFSYSDPNTNNVDVYVKLLENLSQVKFTKHESPQGYGIWSPDGNYMAYASIEDGTCGIYKEPSFGGEKVRIGDCYSSPEDFVWSPDGKIIAFTDVKTPDQPRKIFLLDITTGLSEEALAPEGNNSHRDPAFSEDGQYLVFRRAINGQADIFKMRFSDKKLTQLTFDNARIFGLDVFDDDHQIVFSSNRGGQWALWRVPFTGGPVTRFYINDRILLEPRFSANGKRMIYKSVTDQTQLWSLEKDKAQFTEPTRVAGSTRVDMQPAISCDGKKLAFISDRSGQFEIWVHDNENNLTKLTSLQSSFINMPTWSPDGSEIVFDARKNGNSAVYILDVVSKMVRTFADLEGDQVNARYAMDGRAIYFASNHTGTWQIWKKPVFDSEQQSVQVTSDGGFHLQEGFDDLLYFTRPDTAGLWRMKIGETEELFLPNLGTVDWGSWAPVREGVFYIDRSFGTQILQQPYDKKRSASSAYIPTKRIQFSSPTLTASREGDRIVLAQIEASEDEIMMVDFR